MAERLLAALIENRYDFLLSSHMTMNGISNLSTLELMILVLVDSRYLE